MAFSQVEMASSPPFGCVLRDHNRRQICRESDTRAAIQKNLKNLVQSCVSTPSKNPKSDPSENFCNADSLPQTRDRNNNDTKQANKWAKAREMVFQRETSPAQSDSCIEIPNVRLVSSIVQRWKDFEAESKKMKLNNSNNIGSPVSSSSCNSGSFTENSSILEIPTKNSEAMAMMNLEANKNAPFLEMPARYSEANESVGGTLETPSMTDSFMDWESNRTVPSGCPSARSRDSSATKKERIRVADIIKKLTTVNGEECNDHAQVVTIDSLPKIRTSLPHSPEMKGSVGAIGSRKIRGRQAFNSLLMKMEHDRQLELEGLGERKAVSRFSHRGQIQALLKVRFLRHELEVKNGGQFNSVVSERNKSKRSHGSSIMHLRDRFNTGVEHSAVDPSPCRELINDTQDVEKSSASNQLKEAVDHKPNVKNPSTSNQLEEEIHSQEVVHPRIPHKNVVNNTSNAENPSISVQLKEEIHCQEVIHPRSPHKNVVDDTSDVEACSGSNRQKIDIHNFVTPEIQNSEKPEKETTPSLEVMRKSKNEEEPKANKLQTMGSLHDWIKDISPSQRDWADQDANNFSQTLSEWEEEDLSCQQLEESNQDWIYDIVRPKSDWEDLRQERYQEMLDPFTDNGDIKQLLERKSVSSFLSGGLRDRIDQLMICRTQGQPNFKRNHVEEQHIEEEEVVKEEEKEEELEENEREEAGTEQYEVEEENESPIGLQYCEVEDYFDQTPSSMQSASPSLFKSWSHNPYNDGSDESVASPSLQKFLSFNSRTLDNQRFLSFNSCTLDNQQCSSFRNYHPSIEMELIYDLKGHMEQLHQEIYDLRKSLKSCMDMQVKMQRSAGSANHLAREKGVEPVNRNPRNGTCCLCCESEVDSLLYRCGHTCTCFKCAQELQWGSGKCPICRAPILDVVQTNPPDYRFDY